MLNLDPFEAPFSPSRQCCLANATLTKIIKDRISESAAQSLQAPLAEIRACQGGSAAVGGVGRDCAPDADAQSLLVGLTVQVLLSRGSLCLYVDRFVPALHGAKTGRAREKADGQRLSTLRELCRGMEGWE